MSKRYYKIGGIDDLNFKQAFLSPIPKYLETETFRLLKAHNKQLQRTPFGEIWQFVIRALDKLCSQQKFFDDYLHTKNQLQTHCRKLDLLIKCKPQDKRCSCSSSKKKSYFKKLKFKTSKKIPSSFSRKQRWRFFKKKAFQRKKEK